MNYLQRLARRLTEAVPDNSLRPNVRRWRDGLDPFENWTIAPVTIPLTSIRQPEKQIAASGDKANPEPNRQPSVAVEKTAGKMESIAGMRRKSRRIVPNGKSIESRPENDIHQKKFVKPSAVRTSDKTSSQDVVDDTKSKRLQPNHNRSSIESDHGDSRTISKISGYKLLGRLRQKVSPAGQVRELSSLTDKPGSDSDIVATAPVQMKPAYAEAPPKKAVGRKKTATSRPEAPRLVIGNLKVDVVAVDDKPKSHRVSAAPTRKKKPIGARDSGRGTAKMKFGLGQM